MAAAATRPCCCKPSSAQPNKRQRAAPAPMDDIAQSQPLLPGLPDHLAQLCLSPLPPRLLHAVCRPWRRLLYSPSFPPFLSLYALLDDADGGVSFAAYDPMAGRWDALPAPPMPSPPPCSGTCRSSPDGCRSSPWPPRPRRGLHAVAPTGAVPPAGVRPGSAHAALAARPADPALPAQVVRGRRGARARVHRGGSGRSLRPGCRPLRRGVGPRDAVRPVGTAPAAARRAVQPGRLGGRLLEREGLHGQPPQPRGQGGRRVRPARRTVGGHAARNARRVEGPRGGVPRQRRDDLRGGRGARGAERVRLGERSVEDGGGGGAAQGRGGDCGGRRQGLRGGRRRREGGARGGRGAQGEEGFHGAAAHVGGGGASREAGGGPARATQGDPPRVALPSFPPHLGACRVLPLY